jgi:hypothetical protein
MQSTTTTSRRRLAGRKKIRRDVPLPLRARCLSARGQPKDVSAHLVTQPLRSCTPPPVMAASPASLIMALPVPPVTNQNLLGHWLRCLGAAACVPPTEAQLKSARKATRERECFNQMVPHVIDHVPRVVKELFAAFDPLPFNFLEREMSESLPLAPASSSPSTGAPSLQSHGRRGHRRSQRQHQQHQQPPPPPQAAADVEMATEGTAS